MHAVDDITGVSVAAAVQQPQAAPKPGTSLPHDVLHLTPLDSPLASPGQPMTLPNVQHQPDMREGVAFNLHNNMWGTNYVSRRMIQLARQLAHIHFVYMYAPSNAKPSIGVLVYTVLIR